ncbi:MAG: M24 family metallopeptidase, partial [Elusimicrobiota bacterium]
KKSCELASVIANKIPYWIKHGMKESYLAARINYELCKQGSNEPAFPTIVAFGANSGIPHHFTGDTELKKGDLILVDFGARVGQMNSDITRVFVYGKAVPKQKKIYNHVLKIQKFAMSRLKKGIEGSRLSKTAVSMANAFFKKRKGIHGRMNHGLGHSLGVEVHDGTALGGEKPFFIPEGFVTTLEPGIYIPGWGGIRIEDDVLVTSNGVVNLTEKAYKETLIEIE